MSLFTEEKQKKALLSSTAEEKNIQNVSKSHKVWNKSFSFVPEKVFLCFVAPLNTLTQQLVSDAVLLGSKNSEARRTQRALESGMKHVCSIYTMEFYVFM